MTFRRETDKVIKECLKSYNFKYISKTHKYFRPFNSDIVQLVGFAYETHFRPRYYFLKAFVGVVSRYLNEILEESTDGIVNKHNEYNIGSVYICNCRDWKTLSDEDKLNQRDWIHCEFTGDRPIEDNLADFDKMYRDEIQTIYDKYSTQKAIFLCPITDRYWNKINAPCNWYYVPLAYFFNGEFDKAFDFIEDRLRIQKETEEWILEHRGTISGDSLEPGKAFTAMRKNLKKWIEEKRTFQVDDEYLPKF